MDSQVKQLRPLLVSLPAFQLLRRDQPLPLQAHRLRQLAQRVIRVSHTIMRLMPHQTPLMTTRIK